MPQEQIKLDSLVRQLETGGRRLTVSLETLGRHLGELAQAQNYHGFRRLADAYIDWEIRTQEGKHDELRNVALEDLDFACVIADGLGEGQTQAFFQSLYRLD